jgi:hypothetical protein
MGGGRREWYLHTSARNGFASGHTEYAGTRIFSVALSLRHALTGNRARDPGQAPEKVTRFLP